MYFQVGLINYTMLKKIKHLFLIFKKVRLAIEFKNCHSLVVFDTCRRDLIEREKIQL